MKLRLSLVIISYNMRRELRRTLQSLSPPYQRGIAADEYEIVWIDNGSTAPFDRSVGEQIGVPVVSRFLAPGHASPVRAINAGLALARGELVGVMIDGARLASPGLLAHALQAAQLHPRPVVASVAFHLGSAVQMENVTKGYGAAVEDELLARSCWTDDGYALFDISVLAGSSAGGWFQPLAESNALFLPASMWRELGGFDERFVSPGGGLANLDIFVRACALPDGQLIVLLGEATFHQVHGGISTNARGASPWPAFHEEYRAIRGRDFAPPAVEPLYFGRIAQQVLPWIESSARRARES